KATNRRVRHLKMLLRQTELIGLVGDLLRLDVELLLLLDAGEQLESIDRVKSLGTLPELGEHIGLGWRLIDRGIDFGHALPRYANTSEPPAPALLKMLPPFFARLCSMRRLLKLFAPWLRALAGAIMAAACALPAPIKLLPM